MIHKGGEVVKFSDLHRNIQIRIVTSFLTRAVGSMVFPFMAIYFTETLSPTWAGILLMLNVVASLITAFYGGYIADRIGRKKVMITGQWIIILSFIGMAVANSPWFLSPWTTFFMMLLNSVANGLINPAAEAMLIDVSTKETRHFMYSISYWTVNLSTMIGAMVGGWFFKTHRFELFVGMVIIGLITFLLISKWMTEEFKPTKKPEKVHVIRDLVDSYRIVVKDTKFMIFSLSSILVLALEFQRNNFIAVRLEKDFPSRTFHFFEEMQLNLDGIRMLSFITTENTLLIVLFTIMIANWVKGKKELPLLYLGALIQAVGFGVMSFQNIIPILLLASLIQTIGEMIYVPVHQTIMADIIQDHSRGAYMAINGLVFQGAKMLGALGIILGSYIGGYGMALTYLVLAVFSILLFKIALQSKHLVKKEQSLEG